MTVSVQTFEELSLANPDRKLEMYRGQVREKPPMAWDHTDLLTELVYLLRAQLDRSEFRVHADGARLRHSGGNYFIPDIAVIPTDLGQPFRGQSNVLPIYDAPVPLVIEIWSPSTGGYDVGEKFPEYEARGDLEIWRLHPYERTLTVRRHQPNGSYEVQTYRGGIVRCAALPSVEIDLDRLFAGV